ncbi:MAG TPA: D-glycero-beta-D-manno-heptose 1-phosphate adenylyltransferase [Motilibacteraceae bacterium]|nr:D-glycero-beta-D-manno-heptose 1-phosphate adenylyltransferase [Motilibacteraceae bacterium]
MSRSIDTAPRARSERPLVVVGDVLLDQDVEGEVNRVCNDAPAPVLDEKSSVERPGGAGLAALLAATYERHGRDVVLVTALADDDAARRVQALLHGKVRVVALTDRHATRQKIRLRAQGTSVARLDRGGPGDIDPDSAPTDLEQLLTGASAVLVSDYAGGITSLEPVRAAIAAAARKVPVVWDPHPRGARPVPGCHVVTPNESEAKALSGVDDSGLRGLALVERRAAALVEQWAVRAVTVTLGHRGALLSYGEGAPMVAPAPAAPPSDPCGAGDRFAVALAGALADGDVPSDAVLTAVRAASAYVAAGGATAVLGDGADDGPTAAASRSSHPAGREGSHPHLESVLTAARAGGGTVVATGGCFDLLHAGHIATLRAARELGDCLVVCLNSDASVRRLKGDTRPLVPQEDRVRVLEALECVDAVVVFDEDSPEAVLERIRPDVWVKGGDYAEASLPESALVRTWGGHTVVLPYLDGRSTTSLVETIAHRTADRTREPRVVDLTDPSRAAQTISDDPSESHDHHSEHRLAAHRQPEPIREENA